MELSVFGVSMERLEMLNWLKLVPLSIRISVSGLNFSLMLHVLVRMCKTSQCFNVSVNYEKANKI